MSDDSFERVIQREREEHRRRRHSKARRSFRAHALIYLAVNAGLLVAWATSWGLSGSASPWFLPILLGWGVGLAVHGYALRSAFRSRGANGAQQPQTG